MNLNKYGKFKYDEDEIQFMVDVINYITTAEGKQFDFTKYITQWMDVTEMDINIRDRSILITNSSYNKITSFEDSGVTINLK